MARHILVINGNPDPGSERLSAALASAYADGAEAAGHTVHRINVGGLDFPLLRSAAEFAAQPREPDIIAARGAMLLAQHMVFIYPLWLGGPPALLKAFMEQVARDEFAIAVPWLMDEDERFARIVSRDWLRLDGEGALVMGGGAGAGVFGVFTTSDAVEAYTP